MDDIILLTACINPGGMPFTVVSDATQRLNQYLLALQFYLQNTSCPIVFVDNSNMDKTPFLEYESQYGSRLEILSFYGNKVKTQGKGLGEMEIIEYALMHSKFNLLLDKYRIVKITGRLIVRNINSLLKCDKWHLYPYKSIVCHVNSDLTFADSRIFISLGSFMYLLVKQKKYLNDTKGIYFEHLLCQQIKQQKTFTFFPFITEPHFEGISGSTGIKYEKPNTSLLYKLRYLNFQMGVQKQIFCENDSCSKRLLFRVICMVITYMSSLLIKILQYKTKEVA